MVYGFVRSKAAGCGLALLLLLASAPPARAFCRTTTCAVANPPASCERDPATGCWLSGIPLHWTPACVSFSLSARGSPALGFDYQELFPIVGDAFFLWSNVLCSGRHPSILPVGGDAVTCGHREYNPGGPNSNGIFFLDDWPYDGSVLALTTVSFSASTGKILDADMEINTRPGGDPMTKIALERVIAHEAGHFLGLDHSPETSAVMFFEYESEGAVTGPSLTQDDADAMCDAYPPDRAVGRCDPEPEQGFSAECGGNVSGRCSFGQSRQEPVGEGLGLLMAVAALGLRRCRPRPGRGRSPRLR